MLDGRGRPAGRLLDLHAAPGHVADRRPPARPASIRTCPRSTSRSRSIAPATSTARAGHGLPGPTSPAPPIDYLAKDYASFRRLMLDRMAAAHARTGRSATPPTSASRWSSCSPTPATSSAITRTRSRPRPTWARPAGGSRSAATRGWSTTRCTTAATPAPGSRSRSTRTPVAARARSSRSRRPDAIPAPARSPARARPGRLGRSLALRPEVFETAARRRALYPRTTRSHFYTWGDAGVLPAGRRHPGHADAAGRRRAPRGRRRADLRGSARPATGLPGDADPTHRHAVRLTERAARRRPPLFAEDRRPAAAAAGRRDRVGARGRAAVPALPLGRGGRHPSSATVSVARGNMVLADHGRTIPAEALPTRAHRSRPSAAATARRCRAGR